MPVYTRIFNIGAPSVLKHLKNVIHALINEISMNFGNKNVRRHSHVARGQVDKPHDAGGPVRCGFASCLSYRRRPNTQWIVGRRRIKGQQE